MPKPIKKERGVFQRPKASCIWWIRYLDQNGREHRERVGMKSAALDMYAQRKTEVRMAKFLLEEVKGNHQRATVAEIIDDYVEAGKSRRLKAMEDVKQRLGWFRQRIGDLPARASRLTILKPAGDGLMRDGSRQTSRRRLRQAAGPWPPSIGTWPQCGCWPSYP